MQPSLNLPQATMLRQSESGDNLQSVHSKVVTESHSDFDKCMEGLPNVPLPFCVPAKLELSFRSPSCASLRDVLGNTFSCIKPPGQLRRFAFENPHDGALCATSRIYDGSKATATAASAMFPISANRILLEGGVEGYSECRAIAPRRFKVRLKGASGG